MEYTLGHCTRNQGPTFSLFSVWEESFEHLYLPIRIILPYPNSISRVSWKHKLDLYHLFLLNGMFLHLCTTVTAAYECLEILKRRKLEPRNRFRVWKLRLSVSWCLPQITLQRNLAAHSLFPFFFLGGGNRLWTSAVPTVGVRLFGMFAVLIGTYRNLFDV